MEPALAASVHRGVPLVAPAVHVPSERRPGDDLRRGVEAHERGQNLRGEEQLVPDVVVRGGGFIPILTVLLRGRDRRGYPVRRVEVREPSLRDTRLERRLPERARRKRVRHRLVPAVPGLVPAERALL
eukprot:31342-Pelagococcus_subviridis.AAC.15